MTDPVSLGAYLVGCGLIAALDVGDACTTVRALRRGAREANPLARWALAHGVFWWLKLIGVAVQAVLFWVLRAHPFAFFVALGLRVLMGVWVMYHNNRVGR